MKKRETMNAGGREEVPPEQLARLWLEVCRSFSLHFVQLSPRSTRIPAGAGICRVDLREG